MFKNGVKQQVVMDNYLPCVGDKPCFANAKGKELWVMILEKAWAKVHGNYSRIEIGNSFEPLRDLTGAPSFIIDINQEDLETDLLMWD